LFLRGLFLLFNLKNMTYETFGNESPVTTYALTQPYLSPPEIEDFDRPLNAVFLTSMRDIIGSDQNGRMVKDRGGNTLYMKGVLEYIVRLMNSARTQMLNVVGVIYDDTPKELRRLGDAAPGTDNWMHPADLKNEITGDRIFDVTTHLPSLYRTLPRGDIGGRIDLKRRWENAIAEEAMRLRADILISDHLIAKIEALIGPEIGLKGRVLNIHPAVTYAQNPNKLRGLTPTKDSVERVLNGGFNMTGATLHYVDDEIDAGAPIADAEATVVLPSDISHLQGLRIANYESGKIPVFVQGMEHFYSTHWPIINGHHQIFDISTSPNQNENEINRVACF
jgi:folate-dependent phosphoribosylglycinamide formyltransferase PurN